MATIKVEELYEQTRELLGLELLSQTETSKTDITLSDVIRPGLALAGFTDDVLYHRIQILGRAELNYLSTLPDSDRREAMQNLFARPLPCIIVTNSQGAPPYLIELANSNGVPVFRSGLATRRLMHELIAFLEDAFSPTTTIHGTLVDVYGIGLLYTGSSGIGKSECALDLVERGHRLVADDVVTVRATPQGILMGSGSELLRHHMEIRGIGIIDVQSIFGIRGVRLMKRIEVEVRLEAWDEIEDYERLGLDEKPTTILGIEIPQVTVPIVPGKNLTVISEVVALNHLMKVTGYNPAEEFNKRLVELMAKKDGATLRERLKGDRE